jgi:hypothetical protein
VSRSVRTTTPHARSGEPRLFTPTQLSTHLACAHYTQLGRQRRAGELEVEFMPDPRLDAMREPGAQHKHAYIERLRQAGLRIVDLREKSALNQQVVDYKLLIYLATICYLK